MRVAIAIVLAGAIALAAWRSRALTASGAAAAWIVGACVFGAGSWTYAAVLFSFFIPSTVLSRIGRRRKRALRDIDKGAARDAWQVMANGGVAAACALIAAAVPHGAAAAAFAGAFAAASSDTWGTEIGTLTSAAPRSILTLRPVSTGLSGGITPAGTAAEAAGALIVALVAWSLGVGSWWIVAAAGFVGALIDSLLGASVQQLRYCPRCARPCETDPHACGARSRVIRGLTWMNNDAVNACATLTGAGVAAALVALTR